MNPITFSGIAPPALVAAPPADQPGEPGPGSFKDLLAEAVSRVQQLQGGAEQELKKLMAGEPVELHRVMLASEQAGLATDLLMAVRNKAIDAYQEIMRMQV